MGKEQNSKKNVKKAPAMTAKEKKQAKQAKKIEKKGLGITQTVSSGTKQKKRLMKSLFL